MNIECCDKMPERGLLLLQPSEHVERDSTAFDTCRGKSDSKKQKKYMKNWVDFLNENVLILNPLLRCAFQKQKCIAGERRRRLHKSICLFDRQLPQRVGAEVVHIGHAGFP